MRRLTLAAVVLFSVAAIVVTRHSLEAILLSVARSRTGRELRVQGSFESRWLTRTPSLEATRVTIGDPPWMAPGQTAEVGRLLIELRWRAAWPPFEISRLEIDDATLHLVRTREGRANWQSAPGQSGSGPPLIRSLAMRNAQVELHDDRRHLEFRGTVTAGDVPGDGSHPPPLRIDARGVLNGRPMTLRIEGEPLATASPSQPYHFSLDELSSASHLSGRLQLERPFDFRHLGGDFEVVGEDLRDLHFLIGLSLPDTGPYRLSGRLARQDTRFVYSALAASSGESDLEGALTVETRGVRSHLSGELRSRHLRLADFGARAAGRAPAESSGRLIPQVPFRLAAIRSGETDVTWQADSLVMGPAMLHGVALNVAIEHGRLSIDAFRATIANGRVEGTAQLDAVRDTPRGLLDLHMRGVPLESLLRDRPRPLATGALDARAHLEGEGQSLRELLSTASGHLGAVMPRGAISALVADVASLNVTGALGALFHRGERSDIRCGVADFDAQHGVLATRAVLLDTDKGLIGASGDVHLDSETVALTVGGQPAHRGLSLPSALAISGTLSHPKVALTRRDASARADPGDALRASPNPLDSALRYVDQRLAADPGCAALLAQAPRQGAFGSGGDPLRQ